MAAHRVDAHHHLWDLGRRDQPWIDQDQMGTIHRSFQPSDFAAAASGTGVDASVLVQVLNLAAETHELLAWARDSDLIRAVVGWIDLTDAAAPQALAALKASPGGERLVGVRHQVQAEPDPGEWLARPAVQRSLRAVADAGLAYDLMLRPQQFDVARQIVRAHPGLVFVLDHLGKPPIASGLRGEWSAGIRRLAGEPNVFCKLSGMVTMADRTRWTVADLRPYADTAIEAFGAQRVMFGSDWPVCLLAAGYDRVVSVADELTSAMSRTERDQIFAGTASQVYGLARLGGLR